ncbi:MAG: hypothetical protein Q9217_002132 [Psora testacea]
MLVAAAGPYIHTFDIDSGIHLSTWPTPEDSLSPVEKSEGSEIRNDDAKPIATAGDESHRAAKRRRVSPARERSGSSSTEIVVEKYAIDGPCAPSPPVVKLAATRNGQYVVAVTGEDKCIRVFTLLANGILKECMPKKPFAIAITPDDLTILCADKFGDVYALPLLGQTHEAHTPNEEAEDENRSKAQDGATEPFIPSATSLTVHTKRNRDALRQQQNMTKRKPQKRHTAFKLQLILGHVSLLTDIACASLKSHADTLREYILSADRDEHIRVSRGLPQAHIIEGYCLGHTQFVSKLCFLPSELHLMVSGGGDDYLLLWDWPSGQVKQRVDMRDLFNMFKKRQIKPAGSTSEAHASTGPGGAFLSPIAVSNICTLALHAHKDGGPQVRIIVTIEGLPALFIFTFTPEAGIKHLETQTVEGNVIDTVVLPQYSSIICSLDTVHEPFSTTVIVNDTDPSHCPCVVAKHFTLESQWLQKDVNLHKQLVPTMEACIRKQPMVEHKNAAKGKSLKDLLYSLESLRKRVSDDLNESNE